MKTSANRDLYGYWNKRRGTRPAPERADIEPDAIRQVLGDSFFLSADRDGNFPFRLAGTRVCALFGRELKAESFFKLWGATDLAEVRRLLHVATDEKVGVVAHAIGRTTDALPLLVDLEVLLLPLLQRGPLDARILGAMVPVAVPFWLGTRFVGSLELGAIRHLGPALEEVPAPRLVSSATPLAARRAVQNRRNFVVYEGGRTD